MYASKAPGPTCPVVAATRVTCLSSSTACYLSTLPRVPKRLYLLPARVPIPQIPDKYIS